MFGLKTRLNNYKYRKNNAHNYTFLVRQVDINLISVGKETYGGLNVITHSGKNGKLKIGHYCSIAADVTFLLGGEHNYKTFSTYPFKRKLCGIPESLSKGDIVIEDDVWIGYGALIMSGITVGQGAIIGARSIVTKDVPAYSIFVGNSVIKYRFDSEIISKLLKIDFSRINKSFLVNHLDKIYSEITIENIDSFISFIEEGYTI